MLPLDLNSRAGSLAGHSGETVSIWMPDPVPPLGPLDTDLEVDVCVVGAGISGLSVAYQLSREGKKVAVLDDGPVAAGETERTTAHLSYALDDRLSILEEIHGLELARLAIQSHLAAIDEIESIAERESIQCDFLRLDGYLFPPPGGSQELLDRDYQTAVRMGLDSVRMIPRAPLPSFDTGRCLLFPRNGQFHPLKYLRGLLTALQRDGGRVFANTSANTFEGGSPARVVTAKGKTVSCHAIVVATNSPVNDRVKMHMKQAAYRTFALGLEVPRGSVSSALYWDTAQDAESERSEPMSASYHYVRLQPRSPEHDVLIVGGEDHKTGQADDGDERWARLEAWARERFPDVGSALFKWSGQVMEPADGLAYIGRNPADAHNIFIVTGDSGHGMTHGTIAGMLIRDLILSRPNAWGRVYDPSRKPGAHISISKPGSVFARENLNVAAKYGEYLTPGELKSADELEPETGAVIRSGLQKLAVYKDGSGNVHELSAICPHLKCIVHWNSAEKSWDCPCHGSRFTRLGDVLNGPALGGLNKMEQSSEQRKAA